MTLLSSEFAMKDLGPLGYFLGGITITRHAGGLFLSQKNWQKKLLNVLACFLVSLVLLQLILNQNLVPRLALLLRICLTTVAL